MNRIVENYLLLEEKLALKSCLVPVGRYEFVDALSCRFLHN